MAARITPTTLILVAAGLIFLWLLLQSEGTGIRRKAPGGGSSRAG